MPPVPFWVVHPNDPKRAVAFFREEQDAIDWRNNNKPGFNVDPCKIDEYELVVDLQAFDTPT